MHAKILARLFAPFAGAFAVCAIAGLPASAETVLYSFCQTSGCPDGQLPFSPMVQDAKGNLYGTTLYGGNSENAGTIYELQKRKKSWLFRSLYSFCSQTNCADGKTPFGGLIVDTSGDVYGTTGVGGTAGAGVVYELHTDGTYNVMYNFCAEAQCTDGSSPVVGLAYPGQQSGELYDGVSTLYGTTQRGGAQNWGVVYTIVPGQPESVLYAFGADNNSDDGQEPGAPLIIDSGGNLYGTTSAGGSTGDGTIFTISPSGSEIDLFAFCSQEPNNCGARPDAGALLMQSDGTLIGAAPATGELNKGVIYSFAAGTYSTLANFCAPRPKCQQGRGPSASLVEDPSGNLYGVAPLDGKYGGGTVFEFTDSTLKTAYNFCTQPNCTDGRGPSALLMNSRGQFFGTTIQGGAYNGGVIFELR